MGDSLTDSLLPQISLLVTARMGLHFPTVRWRDLERGIASAASASGFPDAHTYSQWLLSAPPRRDQIEELASHLTVGETYFFREKSAFDALREQILPELIYARHGTTRQLRIWSAGCCSGGAVWVVGVGAEHGARRGDRDEQLNAEGPNPECAPGTDRNVPAGGKNPSRAVSRI